MNRQRKPVLVTIGVFTLAGLVTALLQAQPGRIGIELTPVTEADAAHAGTTYHVALQARLDPGFHVNSNEPLEDFLIPTVFLLHPPDGIRVEARAWPTPIMLEQFGADQPLAVFEEEFVIGAALTLAPSLALGHYVVPGTLRYQACDEKMCYIPTTAEVEFRISVVPSNQALTVTTPSVFEELMFKTVVSAGDPVGVPPVQVPIASPEDGDLIGSLETFEIMGTAGGYLNADQFLEFIGRSESGRVERGWFEDRGPIVILALILLGGLALNLTPCVLPMIPINLAIIGAGAKAGSRLRGFTLGSAYGLAMAVVYGVLGLVVILTTGTFGLINASPWFNLGVALLFIVLALAMFDVLTIDFSRLQSKFAAANTKSGSFFVAFGMGGVAALLAGACVAPVVIQVIVFSSNLYATGTTVALALPFILGVGMALPWPIVGAGLSFLPKPGPWMVRVKQAFGVFILTTAVYYGYLSYGLFSQRWVDPEAVASSVQELLDEGWYASMSQGLQAAQAENKLVLVDIWATWCKNCLTMDKTTLKNQGVQAALEDYVKIKFQGEDLAVSPAREIMERFEAIGLPTYAILRPGPPPGHPAVAVSLWAESGHTALEAEP